MTTAQPAQATNRRAQLITDGLKPSNILIIECLVLGAVQDNMLTGLAWSIVGLLFSAVIPMAYIKRSMRAGTVSDQHVGNRASRMVVLPVIMGSVAVALIAMYVGGAPQQMKALVVSMMATLLVILPITAFWKISLHTAVSTGAIAVLAVGVTWWVLLALPVVGLIGWSRVEIRDHTVGQVIAGTVVGGAVAGFAFALMGG
ncbi:phosphatase PAP2 family protein [Streptomyces hundungensis]|uniref:phosphatase PAP2 family protein n=1 Tax=Streptomyces hundungensis TaxID=1077946 RepID=UPI0033E798DE